MWEDWALGDGVSLWGFRFGALTDSYYTHRLLASSRAWWITPIAITGSYLWAVKSSLWYNRASATFLVMVYGRGTAHGWLYLSLQTSSLPMLPIFDLTSVDFGWCGSRHNDSFGAFNEYEYCTSTSYPTSFGSNGFIYQYFGVGSQIAPQFFR